MKIHCISTLSCSYRPEDKQLIDLDYIVSVGPLIPKSYTGYSIGESHVSFSVYIKIGLPIVINIRTGSCLRYSETDIKFANEERTKLIRAWEERKGITDG